MNYSYVFFVFVLLAGCRPGPVKISQAFLEHMHRDGRPKMFENMTSGSRMVLNYSSLKVSFSDNPNFRFECLYDSIVNDRAWVFYRGEKGNVLCLKLVRIDREWLVDLDVNKDY